MKKKNFFSACSVLLFFCLALASKVNKIHYGAFNYNNQVEDKDGGNYIVKNDGSKISGSKITWKSGMLTKDQIKIDDVVYKISDVRGYRLGQFYYGRLKNEYIKRIVHGKINVYVMFTQVAYTEMDHQNRMRTTHRTRTDHYSQRGEDGNMVVFAGQDDIKKLVADCPLAVEMIDISNSKIRKAIRKDRNYMNSIFEVYNNDCRPVKE